MAHIIKLHHLTPLEVLVIQRRMRPWTDNHNVKIRVLKTCIYIHLENSQNYCGIFNMLSYYWHKKKMTVNKKDYNWVMKYLKP